MKRRASHSVGFVVVQLLAFVLPNACEPLGCWHYSFAFNLMIDNLTTQQNSTSDCQAYCASEAGCQRFTYWPAQLACNVAAQDAVLQFVPTAVSGPEVCAPTPSPACKELPKADAFPGFTAQMSQQAFPSGEVPTNAQCWPRHDDGYPATCPVQKVTVLEDTKKGWPGLCENLQMAAVPAGQTCEENCRNNVLCSIWQVVNDSQLPQCWQGTLGASCYTRPYFQPLEAGRIMHGTYRVLKDLTGIQIKGLAPQFDQTVFTNFKEGSAHCRLACISVLSCQWWLYSVTTGCWAEDVSKYRVVYPMTWGSSTANNNSDFAASVVAGEYIQHYCGGDAPSAGHRAVELTQATQQPPTQPPQSWKPPVYLPPPITAAPTLKKQDNGISGFGKWFTWLCVFLLVAACGGAAGFAFLYWRRSWPQKERGMELSEDLDTSRDMMSRDDELDGEPLLQTGSGYDTSYQLQGYPIGGYAQYPQTNASQSTTSPYGYYANYY